MRVCRRFGNRQLENFVLIVPVYGRLRKLSEDALRQSAVLGGGDSERLK